MKPSLSLPPGQIFLYNCLRNFLKVHTPSPSMGEGWGEGETTPAPYSDTGVRVNQGNDYGYQTRNTGRPRG